MALDCILLIDNVPVVDLLELVDSVRVEQSLSEPARFSVRLVAELDELVRDYPLLVDPRLRPGAVVSVIVDDGVGQQACLVRGPIDRHQIHFESGNVGSWLEVSGGDRRMEMARAHRTVAWSGRDSDIVGAILAGYGLVPDVAQTTRLHSDLSQTQNQSGSDLDFLNRLARRNGFHFWISYRTAGLAVVEVGNFKPSPPRPDVPAAPAVIDPFGPSLSINVGDRSEQTMLSLDIDVDFDRPVLSSGLRVLEGVNEATPAVVPAPPNLPLGARPIASFVSGVMREVFLTTAGDPGELTTRAQAALSEAEWFVQARARTTRFALEGRVLQPHMVVPIKGLGLRYRGDYFVTGVSHTLDVNGHSMDLTLARNALGV
ncbi:phage late control D family protein [Nannocystis pusilla]|uniref:phage late control D family protein n=1 Tax=Nannocystis pusilla TaxID=889268 RepID=UPI003BF3FEE8